MIKNLKGETNKLIQQNRFLYKEEIELENDLKNLLIEHDRTEFANENIEFLFKLIKNLDVFLANNSYNLKDYQNYIPESIFKTESDKSSESNEYKSPVAHVYDDYFS